LFHDGGVSIDVDGFVTYLERRGLSEGTVELYSQHASGELDRLRARSLAPKTRRLILGAFRAYGRFLKSKPATAKQGEALLAELSEVKLPAPVRQRVQKPLPRELYDRLRNEIDETDLVDDPMRAVLGLMAARGIRRGDVLRLERKTVESAIRRRVLLFEVKGGKRLEFGVLETYRKYLELLAESWQPKAKTVSQLLSREDRAAKLRIARALRRVARQLPLDDFDVTEEDVRPHVLRRTYAVIAYQAFGKDITKLMRHMGWSQIQTALGYVDFHEAEELDQTIEKVLG
jgi:integrase